MAAPVFQLMLFEELENAEMQNSRMARRNLRDVQDPFRVPDTELPLEYGSSNVCDARLRILSCYARYPGSTQDSFIWRNSSAARTVKANYEYGDHDRDSGYPCLPWLLVPLSRPTTIQEVRYNNKLKRVRSIGERGIRSIEGEIPVLVETSDSALHTSLTLHGS
ncbi:hypothetical protein CBL_10034 [Carabus blaptoides fortunei]